MTKVIGSLGQVEGPWVDDFPLTAFPASTGAESTEADNQRGKSWSLRNVVFFAEKNATGVTTFVNHREKLF